MASGKARIVIKNIKDFDEAVLKAVSDKFSRKRSQINTIVEEQIGAAVEQEKNLFRPDRGPNGGSDVVGQLGIGFGGRPDNDKINNAYKLLKPGTSSAKVSLSFQRRQANFGRVNYSIKIENFYNSDLTTYLPSLGRVSNGNIDFNRPVPWMRHFIEGLEVQGYDYIDEGDKLFNKNRSRTGEGLMIKIPTHTFVFRGAGYAATFDLLIAAIVKKLTTKPFIKKIENALRG